MPQHGVQPASLQVRQVLRRKSLSPAKRTPLQRFEQFVGLAHNYVVGIAFAAFLPTVWGPAWLQHPTLAPALVVGLGTVAAPFLVMHPAMGAGVAASRTPNPAAARLQSLVTHAVFRIGLCVGGGFARFLAGA